MIERAYKKLALDALVIQQGRLAEQKSENFSPFAKINLVDLDGKFVYQNFAVKLFSFQLLTKMNYYKW